MALSPDSVEEVADNTIGRPRVSALRFVAATRMDHQFRPGQAGEFEAAFDWHDRIRITVEHERRARDPRTEHPAPRR